MINDLSSLKDYQLLDILEANLEEGVTFSQEVEDELRRRSIGVRVHESGDLDTFYVDEKTD